MSETEKYTLSQLDSMAKRASDKEDYEELSALNTAIEQIKMLEVVRAYLMPLRDFNTNNEHLEKLKEITR